MKVIVSILLSVVAFSQQAFAGCHDKCVIRNPVSGHCAFEVNVCPLSVETVGRWLEGATPETMREAFKNLDPTYAFGYYAKKLNVDVQVDSDVTTCLVNIAAGGTLGIICAAGVAEIGEYCFADFTCTAACMGAGRSFKNALENCSLK